MKIRLIGTVKSYTFKNTTATSKCPVVDVSESDGEYLISTGFFKAENEQKSEEQKVADENTEADTTVSEESTVPETFDNIDSMTVSELDAFAEKIGAELKSNLKKQEKAEAIKEFLSKI